MSRMKQLLSAAAVSIGLSLVAAGPGEAAEATAPPEVDWSFNGMFGTFDRASAQRGLEVYKQVCASCHGMDLLPYRALVGIGLTPEQIEALAETFEVQDCCTEEGEPFSRPAKPADRFISPYPNEQAARFANNGALPPDLTLINKARIGGADYIHAVLTGYEETPPEGVTLGEGMYYNHAFKGGQIAMPPPLIDSPEEPLTQQAADIAAFMSWASETNLDDRHKMGIKAILFLVIFTLVAYAAKRKVWASVH